MPKMTLLQIVQDILNDMSGEQVNSIGETEESSQVANVVKTSYYNLITNRHVPEHKQLTKLTALSSSTSPTHFRIPTEVNKVYTIWYDTSDDNSFEYEEVKFMEPMEFLQLVDSVRSNYVLVNDKGGSTALRIRTDKHPEYWTSFDDEYIVMDSYKSTVDNTLQESKIRAYSSKEPTFTISDSFVPDIDANYFPLLLSESKSASMSLFAGGTDPKVEQANRRNRVSILNDKSKLPYRRGLSNYGR